MTLIAGMIAGCAVYYTTISPMVDDDEVDNAAAGLLSFSPTVFFVAFLPPIIFNSGYHLRKELFFRHIVPISLFACVGTMISSIVVAGVLRLAIEWNLTGGFMPSFAELLCFGALISATDPVSTLAVFQMKRVDPHLFYLVFGESVLNDAVGLVLFIATSKFVGHEQSFESVAKAVLKFFMDFTAIFLGSLALGYFSGLGTGFCLKKIDMRNTPLLELSLFVLVMYLPFFLAEILELSGIVTILFTGVSARRYAAPNLSPKTYADSEAFFRVAAHLAETAIFLELGMSVFGLASYGNFNLYFILWAFLGCLLGRALNIYPIMFLFNRSLHREPVHPEESNEASEQAPPVVYSRSDLSAATKTPSDKKDMKITQGTANMLWFSGLRGAVAYACAKSFPDDNGNRTPFVITTMAIVLVTVFVLGGSTEIALRALNIDMHVDEEQYMEEQERYIHNMRQGKKVGQLVDFETRTLIPCVLRNDGVEQDPVPMEKSMSTISVRSQQFCQNVEMTEMEHMGYINNNTSPRNTTSVYDYGGSSRTSVFDYGGDSR